MRKSFLIPAALLATMPTTALSAAGADDLRYAAEPAVLAQNQGTGTQGGTTGGTMGDDMERRDDYDPARDTTTGEMDPMDNRTNDMEEAGKVPPGMNQDNRPTTTTPDQERQREMEQQREEERPWYQFWD